MSKCVLICAGDLLNTGFNISQDDLVIACDAGALYCDIIGIRPNVIIGDFDSITPEDYEPIESKASRILTLGEAMDSPLDLDETLLIKLPVVKDDTDSLAALRYSLSKGYDEFHFYAATGGLLDHTFANIQCLAFLKENGAKGYLWDQDGMITLIKNESISFKKEMDGRVSVFAFNGPARGVTIEGLYYEVKDCELSGSFPIGVSNSFVGKESTVSVDDGCLLVMVYWD